MKYVFCFGIWLLSCDFKGTIPSVTALFHAVVRRLPRLVLALVRLICSNTTLLGTLLKMTMQSSDMCILSSTLWPYSRIRLFANYTTPLSSLCGRMCLGVLNFENACLVLYIEWCPRLSQFAQLFSCIIWGCVYWLYRWSCEYTCTLSYYHNQIGSMSHLPLFMVRSWNNGICYISF